MNLTADIQAKIAQEESRRHLAFAAEPDRRLGLGQVAAIRYSSKTVGRGYGALQQRHRCKPDGRETPGMAFLPSWATSPTCPT